MPEPEKLIPLHGGYRKFGRRNASLILLGALMYLVPPGVQALTRSHPPALTTFLTQALREELFQTLVHIGVTALWLLPVIGARPAVRHLCRKPILNENSAPAGRHILEIIRGAG
jgi:hypothetical protein